jgi:D-3-phosphoglycerate dehydrogenase
MVVMTVDQTIPPQAFEDILAAIGAAWGRTVDLEA